MDRSHATNKNLEEGVKNNVFREDLFYRISVFPIKMPPLRDRKEDIPLLSAHFLTKYAKRENKEELDQISPEALDLQLINEHLSQLLAGHEVQTPVYDFKLGRRIEERRPLRLQDDEILLLDTLHGLYDPLSASVDDALKFRLYIETVLQLRDDSGRAPYWYSIRT